MIVQGEVVKVTHKGALVDLECPDGSWHLLQANLEARRISQARGFNPKQVMREGDRITVSDRKEGGRIGGGGDGGVDEGQAMVLFSAANDLKGECNSPSHHPPYLELPPSSCMQAMVVEDGRKDLVMISTRRLELSPGDMLRDPQLVYENAWSKREEMEAAHEAAASEAASQQAMTEQARAKGVELIEGAGIKVSESMYERNREGRVEGGKGSCSKR